MWAGFSAAAQGDEAAPIVKNGVILDKSLKLGEKDMQWWKDAKFGMFIH